MKFNKILIIISLLFILIASVGVVSASDDVGVCEGVGVVSASEKAIVCDSSSISNTFEDNEQTVVSDSSSINNNQSSDINALKEDSPTKKDPNINIDWDDFIFYEDGYFVRVSCNDDNLTGIITYNLDNKTYVNTSFNNGKSGVQFPGLIAGYHIIEVSYHDDVNYNDYCESKRFRVVKADMGNMTISVVNEYDSADLVHGDEVKVIVDFLGDKSNETGTLSFSLDNVNWFNETLNECNAYHIFDNLNASNYTVYITYSGDSNYRNGSGSYNFTVNKKYLDVNIPKTVYLEKGFELAFPSDMTGIITVVYNETEYNCTIENGKILINVTDFGFGDKEINVKYDGDNNFNPFDVNSTINIISIKVNTTISADNLTMTANEDRDFIITLKDINGNVLGGRTLNLTFNNEKYSFITDEYGQIKFYLANLNVGTYDLGLYYGGDEYHNESSASYKVIVNKIPTTISGANLSILAFNTNNLVVTLKDIDGKVLTGKKITIVFNGKTYTKTTDSNGQAKLAIKSTVVKTYTATIKFAEDATYVASSKSIKVTIKTAYVTVKDIIKASKTLKSYANKKKKLPSTIKVGSVTCTHPQLLYLMSVAIKKIKSGKKLTTKVKVINVKSLGNYNTKTSKKIMKASTIKIVNTLYKKGVKGKLPKYISVGGKKIGYNVYVYSISKILVFYNSKKRLPRYCVFEKY